MSLEEILQNASSEKAAIAALKEKSVTVPSWSGAKGLQTEYDPQFHPVMSKVKYPDVVHNDGSFEAVTRITLDFQRLACRRMTELCCGIPVKRVYSPENDTQQRVASILESVYQRNRIDSVNTERVNMLFAGCEVLTLWYAIEQENSLYGEKLPLKIRCRNFSPMNGDELYPLFDEYGDMVAMSVGYRRKVGRKTIQYFDTYTADRHIKWSTENGDWAVEEDEPITLGKIPAIYMYRPTPIWEDTSKIVYEMEWAMSRNGNYLRSNSKPLFVVFADEQIDYGDEKGENQEFRAIMQYPKGSTANYVTWPQAIDNLKFYISELRNSFFTQLQLPDWSYEKMSQTPMSGEARKQLFIDSQLKVKDESGRLLEFFDRETSILKAFLKQMIPSISANEIDALKVENNITPYMINDDKEVISNLVLANGNKAVMSQRESVEMLGWSSDVDETMRQIEEESQRDVFEPTF